MGEVTCGRSPYLSSKRDQIKMRDYMDGRITSPNRGPPPPCKQALRLAKTTTLNVHHGFFVLFLAVVARLHPESA